MVTNFVETRFIASSLAEFPQNKSIFFTGKDQYRILSIRLKNYDYGQNGAYFVTLCTKNHAHLFGMIAEEKMNFLEAGKIANDCWEEIPNRFQFATLGEWVVMPNHMHGIVFIDKCYGVVKNHDAINQDAINRVSTTTTTTIARDGGITKDCNPMLHQNLATIIRWFKGRTTFEIRKKNSKFAWQPRFYEHVIRNENELSRVSEYVINNPLTWLTDDYYT